MKFIQKESDQVIERASKKVKQIFKENGLSVYARKGLQRKLRDALVDAVYIGEIR
jgi:hypothetical protein